MNGRRLAALSLLATAVASAWYFALYLTRWEWNRAFVAALIFVAAEVALFGGVALERLAAIRRAVEQRSPAPDPLVLARIRESAPAASNPFRWLDPTDGRAPVFVPVLLGAGVIVSAIAWLVERVARATTAPRMEEHLARSLGRLTLPRQPLVDPRPGTHGLFRPTVAPDP